MELEKQYLIQCLTHAANNLRLNTAKAGVVNLFRDQFINASNPGEEIEEMKKVPSLAAFAMRIGDIYQFISTSRVNFLTIPETFKEHCGLLVKELNLLLENNNEEAIAAYLSEIREKVKLSHKAASSSGKMNLAKRISGRLGLDKLQDKKKERSQTSKENLEKDIRQVESRKEEMLLEHEPNQQDEFLYQNFEENILRPIKRIDEFLKSLSAGKPRRSEFEFALQVTENNSALSYESGFEIIGNMHSIFARALKLLEKGKLDNRHEVIESMRACLIVIVVMVRGKDADISEYLNRAERFGRQIININ